MAEIAWLIPLLPLASWVVITLFGRRFKGEGDKIGIAAMALSLVLSIAVLLDVMGGAHVAQSVVWAIHGNLAISFGILVDPLAAIMLVVVTLVSLMVQVFSVSYMHGDSRYKRYYSVLSLFTFAMLGLVMSDNFLLLFMFWELMGLSSFLLIGHYFEVKENSNAAMKAFMTTRTGDIGMFIGMMMLFAAAGTFNFAELATAVSAGQMSAAFLAVAAILVFLGPIGKSAQFPLHVWLPDAMAGPTPASALIHAATMVAAGVFLVLRGYGIFAGSEVALLTIAWVGAITAIFAATIGLVMDDIKKVLAYSTVSQLGFMVAALGVGAFTAGAFHLMTHAFFKALLFLASGSVIHAIGTQDIFKMGGLRKKMPLTFIAWLAGAAALAGLPPFSGFWSKDEIVLGAYYANPTIFWVLIVSALMTAFYTTRVTVLTFFGKPRDKALYDRVRESPPLMTVPLLILAVFATFAGFVNSPMSNHALSNFAFFGQPQHLEMSSFVLNMAILSAVLGVVGAVAIYGLRIIPHERIRAALKPLWLLLKNRYYIDEAYDFIFVRGMVGLAHACAWFDRWIVDSIVNIVGYGTRYVAMFVGVFDGGVIDGFVNAVPRMFGAGSKVLRRVQTGYFQSYALALFLTVVVGLVIFVIGG